MEEIFFALSPSYELWTMLFLCVLVFNIFYLSISDSYNFLQTVKQSTDVGVCINFSKRPVIPMIEDHAIMNGLNGCPQQQWRNIVLDQMYQSLSDSEGGIRGCVRAALLSCPEVDHTTKIKVHTVTTAASLCVCVVIAMTILCILY